ncbi:MAG: hypothetical protein KKB85_00845, partial [Candidatus Altiarchaeota archaeon]|nr:hypothetical protein [Candidatus Altiarchaeota archaeon]
PLSWSQASRIRIPSSRYPEALETKIKARHRAFKNSTELGNFLKRDAPFYISYSAAYYEFPGNQPMSSKNWLGADLVFDLDMPMEFLSLEKMDEVKRETLNLVEFLENDFGFSEKDVEINFSGSKGYHLRIRNEGVRGLGRDERREIVDYVSGSIEIKEYFKWGKEVTTSSGKGKHVTIIRGPISSDSGWAGIIYSGLYNFIRDSSIKELESVKGIGEKKAREIYDNKERILKELKLGRYNYIPEIVTIDGSSTKDGQGFFIRSVSSPLVDRIIHEKAIKTLGAEDTDKMVTIDTARIMRLPDSLHGGSGLKASIVDNIDKFNPLVDSISFSDDEVEIELNKKVPKFDFNDNIFGPFSGRVKIPEYCAVYLLLKGCGEIMRGS